MRIIAGPAHESYEQSLAIARMPECVYNTVDYVFKASLIKQ